MTFGNLKWYIREGLKRCVKSIETKVLCFKRKKDVCIVVYSRVMITYAHPVIAILQEDSRIRVWICFDVPDNIPKVERKKFLKSFGIKNLPYLIAKLLPWDLILYPSHSRRFRRSSPKILIGHGLSQGKAVNGEHFVFGKHSLDETGKIIYQKIFKSSHFIQEEVNRHFPKFFSRVKVVGSLLVDDILNQPLDKNKKFKEFNFDVNKKTVLIASTWGEYCLIQNEAFNVSKAVRELAKGYNVYLTVHPNNYGQKGFLIKEWQQYFEDLPKEGVYWAKPSDNPLFFLPYVDILVFDCTSLGLYFPPYLRPMVHWDNPEIKYAKAGLLPEIKKAAYVVTSLDDLRGNILLAERNFNVQLMQEFRDKIFSHLGQARQRYKEEIYDTLGLSLN